jgi:hypothetical protein
MTQLKKYLPWSVRILLFILFLFSGYTKMFPILSFQKQLVELEFFSICSSPYFARFIVALEIALAFALLQSHYLKKIVIPITISLLVVFCLHLSVEIYKHGAMTGNCGCFGDTIPMTPLEALIKNIITLFLLFYLYKRVHDKEPGQNRWINLVSIYLASALFLFAWLPFKPCQKDLNLVLENEKNDLKITRSTESINLKEESEKHSDFLAVKETKSKPPEVLTQSTPEEITEQGPKKVKSKFSKYTSFGNKIIAVDEGKKIICLFVPGCDHCRDASKEIALMAKKEGFPEIAILFMDEEPELIPEFFKVSQSNFPYQIIDILEFWKILGNDANTPGVNLLWNGNIIKSYEGTESHKFDGQDLKKAIKSHSHSF